MGGRAPRVDHALRDALVVEVGDLLAELEIFEEGWPAVACLEGIVVVLDS